ncbi:hypothetical protein BB8028_0003g03380 [Beauveria bassiana]|uniref:Protein sfk1 n=2 Tax=Beauveria bassiana TaxID=176275 RepID=A0A0A2VI39_BEABA|nr:Protein sfk1 [Beauveria bassiana D1-5]PQK11714.1 hypothetical protein BB8028_0003g03380 [Beauveria bassiana]
MAVRGWISFWWLPIISALVWVGMLLGMLLHWIINDHAKPYPYQDQSIRIVFISNIGAEKLKPLFIAGSCVVCFFLGLSMLASRWLRHRGRLVPNDSRGQKILAVLTIVFGVIGTAGLILLSIFDTKNHQKLHYSFLAIFLLGYVFSAICTCWEYQRLGFKHREHPNLLMSFWAKLTIMILELALAIAFVITNFKKANDAAAVLEWIVAFFFTFFILSFWIDLYPAYATKPHTARFEKRGPREMEEASSGNDGGTMPMQLQQYYGNGTTPNAYHHGSGTIPNTTGAF